MINENKKVFFIFRQGKIILFSKLHDHSTHSWETETLLCEQLRKMRTHHFSLATTMAVLPLVETLKHSEMSFLRCTLRNLRYFPHFTLSLRQLLVQPMEKTLSSDIFV